MEWQVSESVKNFFRSLINLGCLCEYVLRGMIVIREFLMYVSLVNPIATSQLNKSSSFALWGACGSPGAGVIVRAIVTLIGNCAGYVYSEGESIVLNEGRSYLVG